MTQAFRELVQIGITLTSEQDLATLLERILTEARRFTRAEAGTLFLREGDQLRFSVVQNDKLARELGQEEMRRRLQADPLSLRELSLAGHVALTGDILNLHDTYMIPPDRPYSFDPRVDARLNYRTQSILVVPLQDPANNILGVLEPINALDRGRVVPFDSQYERLVRSLAAQAGAITYADRIRAVIEQHPFPHGPVTVSLGLASLPADATTVDDLIVAADQALYDAKRLGRNRVAVQ